MALDEAYLTDSVATLLVVAVIVALFFEEVVYVSKFVENPLAVANNGDLEI